MMQGRRIALVEDGEIMGGSIVQRLEIEGAEVVWLKQMIRALGALRTPRAPIDAVVCDIRLPVGSGEELFQTLCRTMTPPPFLFITGQGGIDHAVRLMQAGAVDYITKPFDLGTFLERLALRMGSRPGEVLPPLIGLSPAARRVADLAAEAAGHERPLLIRGEEGTGKGLVARRVHALSDRRAAPFVAVDAKHEANLVQTLFSDAGALARAGEGVLYLSAFASIPAALQWQLHKSLESRLPARIIVGCDADLERQLAAGGLLPDLYYRLARSEIAVPPLRDRSEDAVWRESPLVSQPHRALVSADAQEGLTAAVHSMMGPPRAVRSRATLLRACSIISPPPVVIA